VIVILKGLAAGGATKPMETGKLMGIIGRIRYLAKKRVAKKRAAKNRMG
jgi:hypothetical protein